jgi:hypothetical protein
LQLRGRASERGFAAPGPRAKPGGPEKESRGPEKESRGPEKNPAGPRKGPVGPRKSPAEPRVVGCACPKRWPWARVPAVAGPSDYLAARQLEACFELPP